MQKTAAKQWSVAWFTEGFETAITRALAKEIEAARRLKPPMTTVVIDRNMIQVSVKGAKHPKQGVTLMVTWAPHHHSIWVNYLEVESMTGRLHMDTLELTNANDSPQEIAKELAGEVQWSLASGFGGDIVSE